MILFLLACTTTGDSADTAKTTDTDTGTPVDSGGDSGEDTVPAGDPFGCPSWAGYVSGRTWTFALKEQGLVQDYAIGAQLTDVDLDAGTGTWVFESYLDYGDKQIDELYTYGFECSADGGLARTTGSYTAEGTGSDVWSTDQSWTYTPAATYMPADFGPSSTWDVDVVVDSVVDGDSYTQEIQYSYSADHQDNLDTAAGTIKAVAVHTTDVAGGGMQIAEEWFSDEIGLVATESASIETYTE